MGLKASNLTLGYNNRVVIKSSSLTLKEGEITSLIGPNGCGKSTLMRSLGGLAKPFSGEVTLDDKDLSLWPRKSLAKRLAMLPQSPTAPESVSLYQLVSHGRYPHQGLLAQNSLKDRQVVEWALTVTGMIHLQNRVFNTLSGGEKQRGWIALSLAQQSDILLLDEPTSYLDIGHQIEILELLQALNKEYKLSIIMVLHDINQASQYSDRIIAIREGDVIADGKPMDVISEVLIERLFNINTEIIQRKDHGGKYYLYGLPVSRKELVLPSIDNVNSIRSVKI